MKTSIESLIHDFLCFYIVQLQTSKTVYNKIRVISNLFDLALLMAINSFILMEGHNLELIAYSDQDNSLMHSNKIVYLYCLL